MVEIHVILALFFFCLLSFFDFIIFNEEILLTLCFLCFLFYCFNTLSGSIASMLNDRSAKFEADLLISISESCILLMKNFYAHNKLQNIITKFSILFNSLIYYLSVCLNILNTKSILVYFTAATIKLNELNLINQTFTKLVQKSCIIQLLYSLILIKSDNYLNFLVFNKKFNNKLIELKTI